MQGHTSNFDDAKLTVRLRPLMLPDDAVLALPWYSDEDTLYFSEGPGAQTFDVDRIKKMYEWLSRKGQVFIVEVFADGWTAIGDAALCEDMVPIVIGDAQYRSRGIGTEVLGLLVEKARNQGWSKVVAHKIYVYNSRSLKLFEKHGFVCTDSGVDEQGIAFHRLEKIL